MFTFANAEKTVIVEHRTDGTHAVYREGVSPEWELILTEEVSPYVPPPEPSAADLRAQMKPISRRQLRLTLVRNGISLAAVQTAIDSIVDDLARTEAQIQWDDAGSYDRLNPTLLSVADAIGLTAEQVDAMWAQALEA